MEKGGKKLSTLQRRFMRLMECFVQSDKRRCAFDDFHKIQLSNELINELKKVLIESSNQLNVSESRSGRCPSESDLQRKRIISDNKVLLSSEKRF